MPEDDALSIFIVSMSAWRELIWPVRPSIRLVRSVIVGSAMALDRDSTEVGDGGGSAAAMVAGWAVAAAVELADELEDADRRDP